MTNRPLPRRARALALTGAVALTLGLAACGGDDAGDDTPTGTATSAAAQDATTDDATTDDAAAGDSASDDAADSGASGDGGPAGAPVESEDGTFSVTLPAGYTQEPVQEPDPNDPAAAQAAAAGSEVLLQAVQGTSDDPADASVIMIGKTAEQDLQVMVDEYEQGLASAEEMGVEGVSISSEPPAEVQVDGETGTLLRAAVSFVDPATQAEQSQVSDVLLVNHGGSSYMVILSGSGEHAASNPLASLAESWQWN